MEWIKTEEQLPKVNEPIEMTCKHWEVNWKGDFSDIYIEQGWFDEFGNFWNCEGPRVHNPSYWRLYQPERSKREDLTSCAPLPKDLEKRLVKRWKEEMLS